MLLRRASRVSRTPPVRAFSEALLRRFPAAIQPHLRLARFDRPTGTYLTFWPSVWGLTLASSPHLLPSPVLVAVFAGGALFMRSFGCVVNDLWDKNFDRSVTRTASRPLASGEVSMRGGVATAAVSLSGAASLLVLLNTPTQMLAACCVAPVALYPLMKRVSWWPQAFLGLTFNWGVLMGSTAVLGSLSPAAVWLYAGCAAWTVSYDTIYGHQDKRDDAALGLKSSSLLDDRVGNVIPLTSALAAAGLWCTALAVQHHSAYACVAAFPASAWAVWLALRVDTSDAASCGRAFKRSVWVGPLMMAGIVGAQWSAEATRALAAMMFA